MLDRTSASEEDDPFVIHDHKSPEGWPLAGGSLTPQNPPSNIASTFCLRPFKGQLAMDRRPRPKWEISILRLVSALVGGLFLLVPLLIMVLVQGELVNLVTTSIAILVCAVVVGLIPKFTPRDSLMVTAGYASIWAVFVGTQKIGNFRIQV